MKTRLSVLYFLQFAVWGSYLTSLGQFLGAGGLGKDIAWFYAAIGLVSILTPALMGHLADRFIHPARLLGMCHLTAGAVMLCAWAYAMANPQLGFGPFYSLYLGFLAFYMPTMALSNTTAFSLIKNRGGDPIDVFPSIRVWGTVGFICAMWMVNSLYWHEGHFGFTLSDSNPFAPFRFQYNAMQLLCAGILGILTGFYSLTLQCVNRSNSIIAVKKNHFGVFKLRVIGEFFLTERNDEREGRRLSTVGIFLIFVALIGVCLQISNGFATPFITHFLGMPEYGGTFAAGNATMLFSISQIAEAICIIFVGKSMRKWGFSIVFGLGILAWCLRFFFFGIGNPGTGLIFLVLSMITYGVAFNFITIAGHLHMERVSPEGRKGIGQGMMMLMSNGIGATAGTIGAGEIINHWCAWEMTTGAAGEPMRLFMGDWSMPWLIFSGFALMLLVGWSAFRGLVYKKGGRAVATV